MRSYTTLGNGKATKVLSVLEHQPARTVTTCPAEAAQALARALTGTDRQIPAALYRLAATLDGTPVEVRRHLLGVYDTVATGTAPAPRDDAWQHAQELVVRLADAVTGQPAAVIAAVRNELADHLDGLDGVLVPARASTGGHKRMNLDLVISGALHRAGDSWWDYLLGPHGDLAVTEDDQLFPTGGECVTSQELYEIAQDLYEAEPCGKAWAVDFDMADLLNADEDSFVELGIRTDHLLAWVRHHRPDQASALERALTGLRETDHS